MAEAGAGGPAALRPLARLAAVSAAMAWLLVVVGGVVRVTGSGMGCPDWPTCFGAVAPPADLAAGQHLPAWIEMAHRYLAALVSLLVAATAVLASRRRAAGAPARWAWAGVAVVLAQILLGAVTVWQSNAPWTVSAHFMAALALVGVTLVTALLAGRPGPRVRAGWADWALLTGTVALAFLGTVVQTTGGGFACPDLPWCRGEPWPAALGVGAQAHMLHRLLALVVGLALAAVAWPAWRGGDGAARRWALAAAALFAAQVAVGIVQVLLVMPDLLRGAHLALAAAFWAAVVGLVLRRGQAARAATMTATAPNGDLAPALGPSAP